MSVVCTLTYVDPFFIAVTKSFKPFPFIGPSKLVAVTFPSPNVPFFSSVGVSLLNRVTTTGPFLPFPPSYVIILS
jgi:hypothetical protein